MTTKAPVFYLFASCAGKPSQSSATVFYKVEGEELAKSLCGLFTEEYGDTNGHTAFHHVAADSISAHDQVLLDEALDCLSVYGDPDPGVYDPKPTEDIIVRAQYAVRARTWEQLMRGKVSPAEPAKKQTSNVDGDSKPLTKDRLPDISAEDWRNALKSVGSTSGAAPPDMSAEEWQNAGLNALMLLAQAYYKILESAIRVPCAAVDLDLNQSYLWVINAIGKLLANHPDLKDFPMSFEPPFQDLFPSSILDLDWEDMVAPEAEKFLSTVQEYVFRKGIYDPEKGSPVWIFIEIIRPDVISAIEKADAYNKRMTQSMQKILKTVSQTAAGRFASGVVPTAPVATDSKPNEPPRTPALPAQLCRRRDMPLSDGGQSCMEVEVNNWPKTILFNGKPLKILETIHNTLRGSEPYEVDYCWELIVDLKTIIIIKPYVNYMHISKMFSGPEHFEEYLKAMEFNNGIMQIFDNAPPIEIIQSNKCPSVANPYDACNVLCDQIFPKYYGIFKDHTRMPENEFVMPIPIECIVRDINAEEKLLSSYHHKLPPKEQERATDSMIKEIRRELAPIAALTRTLNDVAPQAAIDRRKAQLAWIQIVDGCTEIERKAAMLRTGGMTLAEIAAHLDHKNGKPMTRQGVRQVLLRFEAKSGQHGLFSKGTYRQNAKIDSEAQEPDEDGDNTSDS